MILFVAGAALSSELKFTALALALALCSVGFFLSTRLRIPNYKYPSSKRGSTLELSIVIPARNEAHNLPRLLSSIAAQATRLREVIVVDDGSEDDTAKIARLYGAKVLPSQPLPDGWRGKTWACHQGALAAEGQLLCFLDADTWFEPGGIDHILEAYPGGAFSLCPSHHVTKPYEYLSLFFNLNMVLGTAPEGLFGQMLVVERKVYLAVGGYERVYNKILENVHFAHCFRSHGIPVSSGCGKGVVAFRMYPQGLSQLLEGWTKGFATGAGITPRHILGAIIAWLNGLMVLALLPWLFGPTPAVLASYGLAVMQVAWLGRRVGNFHPAAALFYPVALIFFFVVFGRSARQTGKAVTWKGRVIPSE